MTPSQSLPAAGILLCVSSLLHAQPSDLLIGEPAFTPIQSEQSDPAADHLLATPSEPLSEPGWGEPPYPSGVWKFSFDFTMTDFELKEDVARYWTNEPVFVQRYDLAFVSRSGWGTRVKGWLLDKKYRVPEGRLDTRVATLYWDVFRQFQFDKAELSVGGGLAGGQVRFNSPFFAKNSTFTGGGASVVGDGFYPLIRFKKTDFGVIGHARLAVLAPFDDDLQDDQAVLVDDLGLGIELRRRFGRRQDKSWYLSLAREYQHWTDATLPLSVDQDLQSTSLRLGFTW